MLKTLLATGFATLTLAAVAVPASAAEPLAAACSTTGYSISDNETAITAGLAEQGYDVSGVEEWSGCVRAYIVNADGSTSMAFFDPLTLRPMGGDSANV